MNRLEQVEQLERQIRGAVMGAYDAEARESAVFLADHLVKLVLNTLTEQGGELTDEAVERAYLAFCDRLRSYEAPFDVDKLTVKSGLSAAFRAADPPPNRLSRDDSELANLVLTYFTAEELHPDEEKETKDEMLELARELAALVGGGD